MHKGLFIVVLNNNTEIIKTVNLTNCLPILLAISLFSIPISSSLKSIFVPLTLIMCVCDKHTREILLSNIYKPWILSILILFLWTMVACVWSHSYLNEKMLILEKYTKLLYLPILAAGFTNKPQKQSYVRSVYGYGKSHHHQ